MTVVFTLCSANYLAHAKTLGDSLREHDPDYHFVIGLVDRLPKELKASYWHPCELIPVEDLGIPTFEAMAQKYSMVELNTAVKPFYMKHLYQRDPSVEAVIYLDPDVLVCASLKSLADKLRTHNIIVTPHSCTFDDTQTNIFYEIGMLSTGIYNLGFIATSRSDTTFAFLNWWQKRLENYCYYRAGTGMFVDQIWLTLAPLYFADIYVEKDFGYNVCYWNHFERHLSQVNGQYFVNGQHALVFYHFSSYDPARPEFIATRAASRTTSFSERPDLKPIYDDYRNRLMTRGCTTISSLKCSFGRKPPSRATKMKKLVANFLRELLNTLPISIQEPVKRLLRYGRYLLTGRHLSAASGEAIPLIK
jgi:hypothetical protein